MLRVRDKHNILLHRLLQANARSTSEFRNFATPPGTASSGSSGGSSSGSGIGSKLFLTLLGAGAITGGTLVYAKNDQDFRKLLKEYAPWTDDAISLMYQEKPIDWGLPDPSKAIDSVKNLFSGSEPEVKPQAPKTTTLKKVDILAPIPPPKPLEERISPVESLKPVEVPKPKAEIIPEKPAVVLSSITHSDDDRVTIESVSRNTLIAYRRATDALNAYSHNINTLLDRCDDIETNKTVWEKLKNSVKAKEEALSIVEAAESKLSELSPHSAVSVRESLTPARLVYEQAKEAASVTSKYWSKVEQARRHFIQELEILFPNANIGDKKLDVRGGDADALLLLALNRIMLYQQLLAKQDIVLGKKIDEALKGSDEDLIHTRVEIEVEKEKRNLALEYQRKLFAMQTEAEKNKKDELKNQLQIHTAHLQDAMDKSAARAVELEKRQAEERAASERAAHGLRLAAVLGRLQGVDDALKARSDADKMARQSQVLWAASEALEGALRRGGLNEKRLPLAPELDAIAAAAADSDELVAAVLQGVPDAVREKGVLNETVLRDRFIHVEKVCRSVALVPEHGAGLFTFFLSWLQGALLFKPAPPSEREVKDEPTDFTDFDTYDILERARFWVERGEWAQVVRYMQLLKGAPRVIAKDWVQEATLHLEARQAAKVLLAHASATGLLQL